MKIKLIVSILIIVLIVVIIVKLPQKHNEEKQENTKIEETQEEETQIEELKEQTSITGENDNYEIITEYDGRKKLIIKPSLELNTVFAGIIKKSKPEKQEIEQYKNQMPDENGIWISENSREKFLELLKGTVNCKYEIDEKGYLKIQEESEENENDKKLIENIKKDKITIIDISDKCYILDEATAEVVEYPFERMDPYQAYEKFESDNIEIYILTTNQKNKIKDKDIIKQFLMNN